MYRDDEVSPLPPTDLEEMAAALDDGDRDELRTVLEEELDASLDVVRPWRVHAVAEAYDTDDATERPKWVEDVLYREIDGIDGSWKDLDAVSSFKATYVDADRDRLLQLPKQGETFGERYDRVKTWKHNQERINEAGIPTASTYEVVVAAVDGEPYPVAVADYRDDLVTPYEMDDAQEAALEPRFREVAETMEELVADGEVASCSPNDYWVGDGPTDNLGYDPEQDEVVVIDVGELSAGSWDGLPVRFDTEEAFLEYHGI